MLQFLKDSSKLLFTNEETRQDQHSKQDAAGLTLNQERQERQNRFMYVKAAAHSPVKQVSFRKKSMKITTDLVCAELDQLSDRSENVHETIHDDFQLINPIHEKSSTKLLNMRNLASRTNSNDVPRSSGAEFTTCFNSAREQSLRKPRR